VADAARTVRRTRRHRLRLRVVTSRSTSFTVNVSRGGFCTEILRVLPVGTQLEGLLHVAGRDVSFAGRVAWATPGDPRLGQLGRMGVSFARIEPAFARGLDLREDDGARDLAGTGRARSVAAQHLGHRLAAEARLEVGDERPQRQQGEGRQEDGADGEGPQRTPSAAARSRATGSSRIGTLRSAATTPSAMAIHQTAS